jgi:hypothetical protein
MKRRFDIGDSVIVDDENSIERWKRSMSLLIDWVW